MQRNTLRSSENLSGSRETGQPPTEVPNISYLYIRDTGNNDGPPPSYNDVMLQAPRPPVARERALQEQALLTLQGRRAESSDRSRSNEVRETPEVTITSLKTERGQLDKRLGHYVFRQEQLSKYIKRWEDLQATYSLLTGQDRQSGQTPSNRNDEVIMRDVAPKLHELRTDWAISGHHEPSILPDATNATKVGDLILSLKDKLDGSFTNAQKERTSLLDQLSKNYEQIKQLRQN